MFHEHNLSELVVLRANMLRLARNFFYDRDILEVDTAILSGGASIDTHIDLMQTECKSFLHSSPEYGMKKLLCHGCADIYQLSHVFRAGEKGRWHNPEFTMLEWYRRDFSFQGIISETVEFIGLFLGGKNIEYLSYRMAFKKYLDLDPFTVEPRVLFSILKSRAVDLPDGILEEGRDSLLNLALGCLIEPELGCEGLTVLYHYPASQSALAKVIESNEGLVAERFEIYFQGVELANGYHELQDYVEQRRRLKQANLDRVALHKPPYPIDENFLLALEEGLPDCCGVAVGFDRLFMLQQGFDTISKSIFVR